METERNTGKTTGLLNLARHENTNGRKFVWIRDQKQEAEAVSRQFFERFGDFGYRLENKSGTLFDPLDRTMGHFLAVNARTARSGDVFNDKSLGIKTDLIIYDEYNNLEAVNTKQYQRVVQLIESVQRDNPDALLLLVGNRDTPNNPFLHKLGLKPEMDFTTTKTEFVEGKYGKALVVRVGTGEFRVFRPNKSVSAFLSERDPNLERYILGGGFLELGLENVLNYKNWIKPTFRPMVGLIINGVKYVLGDFEHYEQGQRLALCKNYNGKIDSLALDSWSEVLDSYSARASDKSIELFSRLVFDSYKERILFFDEFETLEEFRLLFKML